MLDLVFCMLDLVPAGIKVMGVVFLTPTPGRAANHPMPPSWKLLPVFPSPGHAADASAGLDLLQTVSTALLSTSDESVSDP